MLLKLLYIVYRYAVSDTPMLPERCESAFTRLYQS